MTPQMDLEEMAGLLAASGDYRIMRRLKTREVFCPDDGSEKALGIVLDTETTGLDHRVHEIVELGMVLFEFSPADGRIFRVLERFDQFQEPSSPLSEELVRLTGITNEMLAGQRIDWAEVERLVSQAVLIICHHAAFDRPFCEKANPVFIEKHWACSWLDVNWKDEGIRSAKLEWLAVEYGFFYDSHRAIHDCAATLEVLGSALPASGVPVLQRVLETARRPMFRVNAVNSPFEQKQKLKDRDYHWNDGENGRQRAWWKIVSDWQAERDFLREEIYRCQSADDMDVVISAVPRRDRHSERQ